MPKKLVSSALNHMPSTAFKDSHLSYHLLLTSCNLTFTLTEQNAPPYYPRTPEHQVQKVFFFLIYFLIEGNCFTEFCCFLLNISMNQP